MSIIRFTKDSTTKYTYLNIFPDQFKTEKEKEGESWIKNTMDYFTSKAYMEYMKNREGFVRNYDLVKGILDPKDFYQEPEVKSFTEMLTADLKLASYVQMYSIMTTPINELVGEVTKRPDSYMVKAFDDDSQSEELQFKTDLLQKFVLSNAKEMIIQKAMQEGVEIPNDEELDKMTLQQMKDELDGYTSVAEKWANHILTCTKVEFNLKEKSEETFRDLIITSREFYHMYEDNSKLGYNIEVANPKNVWFLTTPDKKYTSDPSGRAQGAYAAGTVTVMELSEIIETIPDLTKEEIDHLRSGLEDFGILNARESNLSNGVAPGIDSITYDTYDPLVEQTRMIIDSEMRDNTDGLEDWIGVTNSISSFGYRYVVVKAYWISKKKVGKLVYVDEVGNIQSTLVDETYKSKTIPTEISLEWGWVNQWYQGIKIGSDVYHVKPFNLLGYCPIIGTTFEIKNTEARSTVDLMKPFQAIYNVCINQMWELLGKEIGNVGSINVRRIPRVKDGDGQDDIDVWEMEARERGIIFDDDSPENTKAPVSNTSVAKNVDLTRTSEIQSRYNLAVQMKNECWELIGMSKQRLGSVSASESATGTTAAIQQSYSQTEPLFVAHEYVLGQLYQAIIDASLYVESQKPESTLSYINSEGTAAFVKVNGSDLKFRDMKVFATNRPEDIEMFKELRNLAQPLMQNGGSLYEVIELYGTKSIRQMKKVFRDLRDKMDEQQQQEFQQKQQAMEQAQQIADAQIQQTYQQHQEEMLNENYQKELDRLSKERIAIIAATGFGQVESQDDNGNNVPDVLELNRITLEQSKVNKEFTSKLADIQSKNKQFDSKMAIEKDKIKVARENMENDLQIEKLRAKSKANKKD
jgi:hypothetical protein